MAGLGSVIGWAVIGVVARLGSVHPGRLGLVRLGLARPGSVPGSQNVANFCPKCDGNEKGLE